MPTFATSPAVRVARVLVLFLLGGWPAGCATPEPGNAPEPAGRDASALASQTPTPVVLPDAERARWQPLEGRVTRIAFGSCAAAGEPQPLLRRIADAQPELYIAAGGTIHASPSHERHDIVTASNLRRVWSRLTTSEDWRYLAERVPLAGAWGAHDHGPPPGDLPLEQLSKQLFLNAFGEPADSDRRRRRGLYGSRFLHSHGKRIQLILLDTRTFRTFESKPDDAAAPRGRSLSFRQPEREGPTLLGDAQWRWLVDAAQEPADLRVLVCSEPLLATPEGIWQREYRALKIAWARMNVFSGVPTLLLSGSAHLSEIRPYQVDFRSLGLGPGPGVVTLWREFTSSSLTHFEPGPTPSQSRPRLAGPLEAPSFGLIEVDWDAESGALVRLSAIDPDGRVGFEHVRALDSDQP